MALKFNCNNCNEEIIITYAKVGDAIICKKCGKGMTVPENAIKIKEKSDKDICKCPNCGVIVAEEDMTCPKCGASLEKVVESEKSSESDEEISEYQETEVLIRKRHKTIRGLVRFGNFIGWVLIITIIFIPLGLPLLFMGHLVLANLEIEHNTRETATLLRELIEKKNT